MEEIKAKNVRPGMVIFMRKNFYTIIDAVYAQRCQSEPSVNLTLKNLHTSKIENNIHVHAGDNLMRVGIIEKPVKYLFRDGNMCNFLDEDANIIEYSIDNVQNPELLFPNRDVLLVYVGEGDSQSLLYVKFHSQIDVTVVGRDNNKVIIESESKDLVKIVVPDHIQVGDVIRIHSDTKEFIGRISR